MMNLQHQKVLIENHGIKLIEFVKGKTFVLFMFSSTINTKSQNYRKSILSVLNNLKAAKYYKYL